MNNRRLVVCDYDNPNKYTFPNFDMGSSEKRLWHFAKSASEIPGMEVVITGPLWLPQYVPNATHFSKRLDSNSIVEFIETHGHFDFLFSGHEYFDKEEWVTPFKKCATSLISYQLHPYNYTSKCFNGKDMLLFCYSDEMMRMYKEQSPIKALLFHSGVNEDPMFAQKPDNYILWFGRIDKDKAFDIAVETSNRTSMPLYVMGKTVENEDYLNEIKKSYDISNVVFLGFKKGKEKMEIISKAACILYTVSSSFREAGAGVFGEALASGVPIAGMTWTGDDAICAAVNNKYLGRVVNVGSTNATNIPELLSNAIQECLNLDRTTIYLHGSKTYNPVDLVSNILDIASRRR